MIKCLCFNGNEKFFVNVKLNLMKTNILIVGAGPSGASLARFFAEDNEHVTVIDNRNHIGGNCYDYINEYGIRIHKYGPHFFHTNDKRVWEFVNRFSDFTPYKLKVRSQVNDLIVPVPVNIDTVNRLFALDIQTEEQMTSWLSKVKTHYNPPTTSEEAALNNCGNALYSLLFKGYTQKQWGQDASKLEPSVLQRIPIYHNKYDGYFRDEFQGLPIEGYTNLFKNMLNHPLIETYTSVDYFDLKGSLNPKLTVYTGRIDRYYADRGYNQLEYRSLHFEQETYKVGAGKFYQSNIVINYPELNIPYTRSVEYKHIPFHNTIPHNEFSTIVKEYPRHNGEAYYPVPNEKNRQLYNQYKELASNEANVLFSGRLANYKYYNMDQAFAAAMDLYASLKKK